jgi:alkanesulfonate monooxygenase SsuD/methylene tetrahydromethanopterin reductase-like flavin-dependent oxidoreductase (luciferase family)
MTTRSLFGVALAHSRRRFAETLETARLAEDLGADLVTLADHPYLPAELETWTTLTTLAAHTERISVGTNVLNVGLRPPVMLAKAAATLQFASGGRLVLGLGAGIPQATAGFGGPERSLGDTVAAFDEALGLIRRLWRPGPAVHHDGRFVRLAGTELGPKPDPEIPLWIGSFGPRMLDLTGRHADGWLPTNAYLDLADVPQMQARIDKGAADAGRDPAEIRRVLNVLGQITDDEPSENGRRLAGPVGFWVEALRDYQDRLGFDSFVFWPNSDRPDQTRLFLERVRPRLS